MSQHAFATRHQGKAVTVIYGFDRPLQYVFMLIENDEAIVEDDAYVYSNLSDAKSIGAGEGYFKDKLKELEIAVPETMFIETRRDQEANVGNRYCVYQENGTFIEM
jgi:hypothetical protein